MVEKYGNVGYPLKNGNEGSSALIVSNYIGCQLSDAKHWEIWHCRLHTADAIQFPLIAQILMSDMKPFQWFRLYWNIHILLSYLEHFTYFKQDKIWQALRNMALPALHWRCNPIPIDCSHSVSKSLCPIWCHSDNWNCLETSTSWYNSSYMFCALLYAEWNQIEPYWLFLCQF